MSEPQTGLRLKDILDLDAFRRIAEGYAELDGLGITLFDLDGERVVQVGPSRLPLCEWLNTRAVGAGRCKSQLAELASTRPAPGTRGSCTCFTGYQYRVVPVEYDGANIGRLAFGPMLEGERRNSLPPPVVELCADAGDRDLAHRADHKARRHAEIDLAVDRISRALSSLIGAAWVRNLASRVHTERSRDTYAELEQQNRRLEEMVARLSELDRMKSSFLQTISHELRTPLTSVIGYAEMLIEGLAGPLGTEQQEYVRTILGKGEQLLGLINALIEFSKAEAGAVSLSRGNLELGAVVRDVLDQLRPEIRKKRIEVRVASPLPRAFADREKLRKALEHILGNAVKFTPEGGQIEVGGEESETEVRLRVVDTGIGIPKDAAARIFEPFFQADATSTREYGGAGIGLSIAKRFLEVQEGRVAGESAVGRGSTFFVYLPRGR